MDRHPSALCRHLDDYLERVAVGLRARGVLTCPPRRSDPAQRLTASLVLDCTAFLLDDWMSADLRSAAGPVPGGPSPTETTPTETTPAETSLAGALHPGRPTPVAAVWDEHDGWCVELSHDAAPGSRRYLHPELFPETHLIADFVVGLALGRPLGADHPADPSGPGPRTVPPRLRAV